MQGFERVWGILALMSTTLFAIKLIKALKSVVEEPAAVGTSGDVIELIVSIVWHSVKS